MRRVLILALSLTLVSPAYAGGNCTGTSAGIAPLTEAATYQGFEGGLYPGGTNERPAAHTEAGLLLARLAVPRNAAGLPDPAAGTSVFLSIGMSNTRNEFTQFVPLSQADTMRHPRVRAVNGAIGGYDAERIKDPASDYWTRVDQMLIAAGATPAQVQMVWLKEAIARPTQGFPAAAELLRDDLRTIVRILKVRFPNLWVVFLASRIYAGYATTNLNPEPYAFESGLSVRWVVGEQIGSLPIDRPWLSWGPYLWADGLNARADGFTWACEDFNADGTHPNTQGSLKVARMLLDFVHADPVASAIYTNSS